MFRGKYCSSEILSPDMARIQGCSVFWTPERTNLYPGFGVESFGKLFEAPSSLTNVRVRRQKLIEFRLKLVLNVTEALEDKFSYI
jgi:hypothetical protein